MAEVGRMTAVLIRSAEGRSMKEFKREISTILHRTHCSMKAFCQSDVISKAHLYDLYEENEKVTLHGKTLSQIVSGLQNAIDEAVRTRQKVGEDVAACFSRLSPGLACLRLDPASPARASRILVDQAVLAGLYGGKKSKQDPPDDPGLAVAPRVIRHATNLVSIEFEQLPDDLDHQLAGMAPAEALEFIRALTANGKVKTVRVIMVRERCTEIVIEMSTEEAEAVRDAFKRGDLTRLGVAAVSVTN
jgi:hypothetical protein